jgi:hypothetical protein
MDKERTMTFTQKLKTRYLTAMVAMTPAFLTVSEAFAQTNPLGTAATDKGFAKVTNNFKGQLASIPALMTNAMIVLGIGFTIGGLFKLKSYTEGEADDLKAAIIRLFLGALLLAIPFVLSMSQETLGSDQAANVKYGQFQ